VLGKKNRPPQPTLSVYFTGEFSPNFDLKNMISTYTKDFSMEKKCPNSPESYDNFQKVAKNIKGYYNQNI
jgi:hypothetical protein